MLCRQPSLLALYEHSRAPASSMLTYASCMLAWGRQASLTKALCWGATGVTPVLANLLRQSHAHSHALHIQANLCKMEEVRLRVALADAKARHVHVTSTSVCSSSGTRLGCPNSLPHSPNSQPPRLRNSSLLIACATRAGI